MDSFDELLVLKPYIQRLSVRVDNFVQKKHDLWNCSCPLPGCGDNATTKSRARMYIFNKDNVLITKCHNCGTSMSFKNFLRQQFPDLYSEFVVDILRAKSFAKSAHHDTQHEVKESVPEIVVPEITGWMPLNKLQPDNIAVQYAIARKLPKSRWDDIYYVQNFYEFALAFTPNVKPKYKISNDPRIVLPIRSSCGKMIGMIGRALQESSRRYIHVTLDEHSPRIYGLDKVKTDKKFIVVESAIDSLMLKNAVAVGSSKLSVPFVEEYKDNAILVPDNEPRSKVIVRLVEQYIEDGYSIWLYPNGFGYKDFNESVIAGMDGDSLSDRIIQESCNGLKAMAMLSCWRKV